MLPALVLEEIAPEDRTRNEVLGARVKLYMAAKKWDMAAAVASHLVKVEPGTAVGGSASPIPSGAPKVSRRRRPFCCGRNRYIPKVAMIAFNLACYASVTGRKEEAKERLRYAIDLDKDVRKLAIDDEDLKPLWDWIAGLE